MVQAYFSHLTLCDLVIEPSCGESAFLAAIPDHVPAIGVEIDPVLAAIARRRTGRTVIDGDFSSVTIEAKPSAIIGNPPFKASIIMAFLDRARAILRPEPATSPALAARRSMKRKPLHWHTNS